MPPRPAPPGWRELRPGEIIIHTDCYNSGYDGGPIVLEFVGPSCGQAYNPVRNHTSGRYRKVDVRPDMPKECDD